MSRDLDELVEAGAKAIFHHEFGDDADWERWASLHKEYMSQTRAILTAVLPLVLKGPREALELATDEIPVDELSMCGCSGCVALRRARSALASIDALIPPA